jgi:IS5 family transposase
VLATTVLLQAHEGLSDQEACDRLERDLAWQAAAGVHTGYRAFHPTTLTGLRNRLRASGRPRRLFEDTRAVAEEAGLLGGRARVLDSTPLYDAVATQDTVTALRSAIRKLLRAVDRDHVTVAARVRSVLRRDDDYAAPGKPPCDWDDPDARDQLIDALVRDAQAALEALDGEALAGPAGDAAELLALVAGQDIEHDDSDGEGLFRIARRVARDRVISTVDPEARHGHKSRNRRFDGYKAHMSVDPDTELIDEVVVTPANVHDSTPAQDLLAPSADAETKPEVFADSAYAGADTLSELEEAGYKVHAKVPSAANRQGRFSKDDFVVDLDGQTVTCPADWQAPIRLAADGSGTASFAKRCTDCPLRERCTTAAQGRTISIHPKEAVLQQAKAEQADPDWQTTYQATRPKVERKIAHYVRAAWGGRKARTRGLGRIATDADTRAAAVNWARLDVLGLSWNGRSWMAAPP